jgi:hypothetical protein
LEKKVAYELWFKVVLFELEAELWDVRSQL